MMVPVGMNEILVPDADSVPDDWQMVELGTVTDVKGGKRLPKGTEYSDHVTEHPYIRVTDFDSLSVRLSELKYISGDTQEQVARYTISKDDVYISIAGTIGLVGTIPDGLTGANLTENAAKIVIRDAEKLLNRYLALWLSSSQGQAEIRLRTTKTSQPKLALMRIKQIPIPLPPLPEQRRIAAVLNAIQDAIAAQEDVIAAARQLKRSLMQRLFTVGPYREPAETKETEIGEIPAHWESTRIGEMHLDISDGNYASKYPKRTDFVDEGVPFIRSNNMRYSRIIWEDMRYITPEKHDELKKGHLKEGDILITTRGQLGNVALVSADFIGCNINAQIVRINGGVQFNPEYLVAAFQHPGMQGQIDRLSTGTTLAQLPIGKLKQLAFPIASIDEQREIGFAAGCIAAKIAAEEDRLTALQTLFKSMLHQLMTGQIRLLSDEGLRWTNKKSHA